MIIFNYNLYGKVQAGMFWYYPQYYTGYINPPDAGIRAHIKHFIGVDLDAWIWDHKYIKYWELGGFNVARKRIVLKNIPNKACQTKRYWRDHQYWMWDDGVGIRRQL